MKELDINAACSLQRPCSSHSVSQPHPIPYIQGGAQTLSHVWLLATPWSEACQASLSITNSRSSLRLISIESVMPSSHLILGRPLLLLPSIHTSWTKGNSFLRQQLLVSYATLEEYLKALKSRFLHCKTIIIIVIPVTELLWGFNEIIYSRYATYVRHVNIKYTMYLYIKTYTVVSAWYTVNLNKWKAR